jgi:hypothetical protein
LLTPALHLREKLAGKLFFFGQRIGAAQGDQVAEAIEFPQNSDV